MKKQHWVSFQLAEVSLTDFGAKIPSPFSRLSITNNEVDSYTSWELSITVGGDSTNKMNIAAFESLIYSSAQAAAGYEGSAGIPVSFAFGWLNENGGISDYTTFQGWSISFNVSSNDMYLKYTLTGYATLAVQMNMPVINIPAVCGMVQPSAVVIGLAKAIKADTYYDLDVDRCDSPVLVNHNAMTTSFTNYVRGSYSVEDNYDDFPGLLKLAKNYNASRDGAGLGKGIKKLSQVLNNRIVTPVADFLKKSLTDNTPQSSSFSYWVDEPTMTKRGCIHFKSNAVLSTMYTPDTLEYGTSNTNVISISGSYNGVAYDMSDMNFAGLGFSVDGSGNTIINDYTVTNSWSSSLADVFQTSSIINDINVLATQFAGNFEVTVPGTTKQYHIAQPITLIVRSGNTTSPISGIYNIMKVSHSLGTTFTTSLTLQRLITSSANQTAITQGILIPNADIANAGYTKTKNIISTSKVQFGEMYPNFEHLVASSNLGII